MIYHDDPYWNLIIRQVLQMPAQQELSIMSWGGPHPRNMGFYRSVGLPPAQVQDWRLALPDGRGIHVREERNGYKAHWDHVDPSVSLLGHLRKDVPWLFVPMCVVAAGLFVRWLGES